MHIVSSLYSAVQLPVLSSRSDVMTLRLSLLLILNCSSQFPTCPVCSHNVVICVYIKYNMSDHVFQMWSWFSNRTAQSAERLLHLESQYVCMLSPKSSTLIGRHGSVWLSCGPWLVDAAQNVSEVMLEFAQGSSELSARWRHWFNMCVALYTAKTTTRLTSIKYGRWF